MSHPNTLRKTQLTIAIGAALAGLSFAQPAWSACTVDGSTFTVDTISDVTAADGVTTFREAVVLANNAADCDTINFDPALNGQTITLTGFSGLVLSGSTNVIGPGSSLLTITNSDSTYGLNSSGGDIDLSGLTFDDASSKLSPGASGSVTVDDIIIKNSGSNGLEIRSESTISVSNTTVIGSSNAGLRITTNGGFNLSIDNSTFTGNTGAGIDIRNGSATPITVAINNTTVDGNTNYRGAGIQMSLGDSATGDSVTISNSTISNNTTTNTLNENFIENGSGGGILLSDATLDYNLTIVQSTISGNTANAAGGGIFIGERTAGTSININHSTITNNTAEYGGGLFTLTPGSDVNLSNTIVAANTANSADLTDEDVGVSWTLGTAGNVSADYSFIGTNFTNVTDAGTGSILNGGDPALAALADGGNGTKVHALTESNTLLLDLGDPALTAGTGSTPTTDQAGNPRVETGRIDIGSVELFIPPPEPKSSGGGSSSLDLYLLGLLSSIMGLVRIRRKK